MRISRAGENVSDRDVLVRAAASSWSSGGSRASDVLSSERVRGRRSQTGTVLRGQRRSRRAGRDRERSASDFRRTAAGSFRASAAGKSRVSRSDQTGGPNNTFATCRNPVARRNCCHKPPTCAARCAAGCGSSRDARVRNRRERAEFSTGERSEQAIEDDQHAAEILVDVFRIARVMNAMMRAAC